ncbi:S1 family peptidase [Corynebacterium parakroppenstedtii]|nr:MULTISPECIES: S1 family peptidase [Corynebacterium]PMC65815.1 S1 family peptidase [Corynebacterium kroppenstedtii]
MSFHVSLCFLSCRSVIGRKLKIRKVLSAIACAAACVVGTTVAAPSANAVADGYNAVFEPWSAEVLIGGVCSGSVLSDRWVITAAHCLGNSHGPGGHVKIGERAQQTFKVDRVVREPGGADVALVRTDVSMGVRPIMLPSPGPMPNQPGQFTGWGHARFPEKQGLAFVSGPTRGPRPGNADMFETKSIIGHQEHGDSGGAFHIGPVLYGVLCSSSGKDGQGRTMANYTKVDQFLPWIYGTIFTQSWP